LFYLCFGKLALLFYRPRKSPTGEKTDCDEELFFQVFTKLIFYFIPDNPCNKSFCNQFIVEPMSGFDPLYYAVATPDQQRTRALTQPHGTPQYLINNPIENGENLKSLSHKKRLPDSTKIINSCSNGYFSG
jgi:hypothetical protein